MDSPIIVAGLEKSGKTSLICALIQIAFKHGLALAAFKPFDTGIIKRNAEERIGDGELFCRNMTGEPMEALVAPYIANEDYPVEMAFRRDSIKIDWNFIRERLKILGDLYNSTLVELPPSLFTPITEKKMTFEWLQESGSRLIWLIHPTQQQFERNLAEIHLLKSLGLNVHLVMNNASKITNQDLLFYIWEKIEKFTEQEMEGMIPFVKNLETDFVKLGSKIEENLPGLMDRLFGNKEHAEK
ncbi:MAG: AAA family ATPase [Proteobacteria bacterium]|nr:AAA family ATPase [Pseudomonadota bacterium]